MNFESILVRGIQPFLWNLHFPMGKPTPQASHKPKPWKMEMQWVDFGLLMCTCFLGVVLAQVTLGLTLDVLKPDHLEKHFSAPFSSKALF